MRITFATFILNNSGKKWDNQVMRLMVFTIALNKVLFVIISVFVNIQTIVQSLPITRQLYIRKYLQFQLWFLSSIHWCYLVVYTMYTQYINISCTYNMHDVYT